MKVKCCAKQVYFFLVLSIFSLIALRCAVAPGPIFQKDGKIYGKIEGQWGGRWWNYYQRGMSYAQGGYWDYAIMDFQHAIMQRSKDQRRARTYGLHILDDYFPHRELGIVYFHQNRFEESIAEIEISLKYFESSKAKYFLNQARQGLLMEKGLDLSPPKLNIFYPKKDMATRSSSLVIKGEAIDDCYVSSIFINNKRVPFELSNPVISFQPEIRLKKGRNNILVEAFDLVGKSAREEIQVWCDQEAPVIYFDQLFLDSSKDDYIIEGYITDESQIAGFKLNGQHVDFLKEGDGAFSVMINMADLLQPVTFEAHDVLGNTTTGELNIDEFFDTGVGKRLNNPQMFAYSGSDTTGLLAEKAVNTSSSNNKPIIRLKEIPDNLTVDWNEFFLEGEARDKDGIKSVVINDIPLIKRTSKVVFFNFFIPLEIGDNLIMVQAENLSGELMTKQLVITRKLNQAHEISSRLHLAVLPFKYRGDREEFKDLIYDSLIKNFVSKKRFRIVDREKIDNLLKRGRDFEDNIVELGRIVSAEGIIVGSAYFYDNYLELIARVIDTETTVVIDSEEVFGPINSIKDVDLLADGLSFKFKQAFPIVEGRVIGIDLNTIQIDLGKSDNILPYMRILYFREGDVIKDSASEKVLEQRVIILAEGKVIKVYNTYSDATVLSKKDNEDIMVRDFVITK